MAENTFKIGGEDKKKSLFSKVGDMLGGSVLFRNGIPVNYLPHAIFLAFLGIIYIGNNHYAEKNIRKIKTLEVQVGDMRADYITLKSEYMYARLQSEVAKKVKDLGLEESSQPPKKVVIKEGEY